MTTSQAAPPSPPFPARKGPLRWLLGFVLHIVIPAVVLFGAWKGATYLLETAPTSERKPRPRKARSVSVLPVRRQSAIPRLEVMGVVRPAREVMLRSRVGGQVISVADAFEPGGRIREGEVLLQVERADYEFALAEAKVKADRARSALALAKTAEAQARTLLAQRRTALAGAEASLRLEEGNQAVALREFELLGGERSGATRDLVLRAPQLAIAQAAVDAAKAGIAAAEAGIAAAEAGVEAARTEIASGEIGVREAALALERTKLVAPFNARIQERFVEVGAVLASSTNVARLIGTDVYWIEASVPMSDLRWICGRGGLLACPLPVTIRDESAWGPDVTRTGTLLRLLGDLEAEGRMARILVEVDDPLHIEVPAGQPHHPLLTRSFVRIEIEPAPLDDVVVLPRQFLRHGDVVWVANDEKRLEVRNVEVRWRGRDHVFVSSGLEDGDLVVTSDLSAPVPGMTLAFGPDATEPAKR